MNFDFPKAEFARMAKRRWILNFIPKKMIGAEFGVFRGHFSEIIAQIAQPQKLFLVDFWTAQGEYFGDYGAYTNNGLLPTAYAKKEVEERMRRYRTPSCHIQIVEQDCLSFMRQLQEKLDFVYLDTYHTYNETLQQLEAIDRVLNEEGLILGDDWWPDRSSEHHGVFLAIHDFIKSNSFEIVACGPGGQYCLRRSASN